MDAENKQIQGRVVIHLLIDENGNVESAEPVSGNPILTDAAIRAMKTWKFKPYFKDGHAVKVSTKMPFDFAFSDRIKDLPETMPARAAGGNTGSSSPQRISLPQGVSRGYLIHKVTPVYPMSARMNHVQGTVVLRAVIGKDGHIEDLHVVSGPSELTAAAIGAVEQWRYKPFLRDGEPVEVETNITVNFTLSGF
jgi:TonB family protein